jgi:hypothetical protein
MHLKELFLTLAAVAGVIAATFAVLTFGLILPIEAWQCSAYGKTSRLETELAAVTCMVNDPVLGWVSVEQRTYSMAAAQGLSK